MNDFMKEALEVSYNSEDPNTQVGCVILDHSENILGKGFNHFPIKNVFPTIREGSLENTKYPYIIHAEQDALFDYLRKSKLGKADIVYVTLFPCSNCAKLLVQANVREVFYLSDKYNDTPDNIAAKQLFDKCGVKYKSIN